jgi:butyrate kinase
MLYILYSQLPCGGCMYRILAINPGSTSTKISVFWDEAERVAENIHHSTKDLSKFNSIADQFGFRNKALTSCLQQHGIEKSNIDAVVARGGLLKPIPSGTYLINKKMLNELFTGKYGEHASNLGAIIANEYVKETNKPSFIVDPVVVDEMFDLARLSGHPLLPRKSIFHALNHKAIARKTAQKLNSHYKKVNLIVAHVGGGISVAAHRKGKIIDVNNALDGEGPYTPERSGSLPVGAFLNLSFNGKYKQTDLAKMIKGKGGLTAYLGTNNVQDIEQRIKNGDESAEYYLKGMAYQISKTICSFAAVLKGNVDAIALTGGVTFSQLFTNWIKERINFLAPVFVFPGGAEMEALALGALRVLRKEENLKQY